MWQRLATCSPIPFPLPEHIGKPYFLDALAVISGPCGWNVNESKVCHFLAWPQNNLDDHLLPWRSWRPHVDDSITRRKSYLGGYLSKETTNLLQIVTYARNQLLFCLLSVFGVQHSIAYPEKTINHPECNKTR